jgi:hypothetical protein
LKKETSILEYTIRLCGGEPSDVRNPDSGRRGRLG